MKFLDYADTLDVAPARLALLSTYQFDPEFFERRLLRTRGLAEARRIAVFVDARQWTDLTVRGAPARLINRRYLVVPVRRSTGVFHPKLNLLVSEASGLVQCGSNNLTRSGCASNLELLNSVPFDSAEKSDERALAQQAFRFFRRALEEVDSSIASIVCEWMDDCGREFTWILKRGNSDPHGRQPAPHL